MRISDWSSDVCSSDLCLDARCGNPVAGALIGIAGIDEAITDHISPSGQRRRDGRVPVCGAGGEHQQHFGGWRDAFSPVAEHDAANRFGQWRATRLARQHDLVAIFGQPVANEARLRRLAGALRSEEHTSELQSLMRLSYAV